MYYIATLYEADFSTRGQGETRGYIWRMDRYHDRIFSQVYHHQVVLLLSVSRSTIEF